MKTVFTACLLSLGLAAAALAQDSDPIGDMLRGDDPDARDGETVNFGALAITPHYCRRRPPEETPETYAFLEIRDRRTDGFGVDTDGEEIFSGWMFASRPAQNPLEHPVYDVWVIDCRA